VGVNPTMPTPELPPEIWLKIAHYVPSEEQNALMNVSSLFFDVRMNSRWRQVVVITRKTGQAMHTLERLRCVPLVINIIDALTVSSFCSDPFVAKRVKSLVLRLTHVKDPATEAPSSPGFRHQLQHAYHRFRPFKLKSREGNGLHSGSPLRPRPTFSEVMNTLITAISHMSNVSELNIDSWDLPPSYDLRKVFHSMWASFGNSLDSLFLGGNLEGYRVLIAETHPTFRHLRELRIELTNNLFRLDQDADERTLVNVLAPFITGLSSTLESLRIWSWAFLDISAFFGVLAETTFPHLESLNIRMAFNKALHDPTGLQEFLWRSSATLKRVELRLNPSGLPLAPATEEPLSVWLAQCLNDERCFRSLNALDLYPTNTEAGLAGLLTCIKRTEATLVELSIRDRYLQTAEAKVVVEAASRSESGLKSLRMNIWHLEVGLLDILANKISGLERLWLSLGDSTGGFEGDSEVAVLSIRPYQ